MNRIQPNPKIPNAARAASSGVAFWPRPPWAGSTLTSARFTAFGVPSVLAVWVDPNQFGRHSQMTVTGCTAPGVGVANRASCGTYDTAFSVVRPNTGAEGRTTGVGAGPCPPLLGGGGVVPTWVATSNCTWFVAEAPRPSVTFSVSVYVAVGDVKIELGGVKVDWFPDRDG